QLGQEVVVDGALGAEEHHDDGLLALERGGVDGLPRARVGEAERGDLAAGARGAFLCPAPQLGGEGGDGAGQEQQGHAAEGHGKTLEDGEGRGGRNVAPAVWGAGGGGGGRQRKRGAGGAAARRGALARVNEMSHLAGGLAPRWGGAGGKPRG